MSIVWIEMKDLMQAKLLYYLLHEFNFYVYDEIKGLACRILSYCDNHRMCMLLSEMALTPDKQLLARFICEVQDIDPRSKGTELYPPLEVKHDLRIRALAAKRFLVEFLHQQISLRVFLGRMAHISNLPVIEPLQHLRDLIRNEACFVFQRSPVEAEICHHITEAEIAAEVQNRAPGITQKLDDEIQGIAG